MNKQSKTKIIALLLASNMVMSATSGLLTVTASATTDTQVSATNVATTDIVEDGQIIDTQTSNFTNVGEEAYTFYIDEDGVITGFDHYDTSVTDIVIPSEIDGTQVTGIGGYLFHYNMDITSVTISEGVTSIGESAFESCHNLISVTMSEGVISIGDSAFEYCSSLTSVTLPSSVTTIEYEAFVNCESLTDVYYSGTEEQWDNISVAEYNYPLNEATKHFNATNPSKAYKFEIDEDGVITGFERLDESVTDIVIPSTVNGKKVTAIGDSLFSGCEYITSVTIPEGVTTIWFGAFESCSGLTSITLPSTLTEIKGFAFDGCSSLKDVYYNGTKSQWEKIEIADNNDPLNNANKHFAYKFTVDANGVITSFTHLDENVTDIVIPAEINGTKVTGIGSGLFRNNKTITSVTIPEGVTSIGVIAFYYCTSLKSVTIPEGVTSIGDRAFYGCLSLTTVTIPSTLTSIGEYALYYCTSLTNTDVNANNQNYSSDNGVLYNKDKTTLICYPAGKTDTSFTIPSSVTSIGYGAFTGCKSLTSITIPEGVTSIGMATFTYCTGLTSVTIPSSVTEIGMCAFYECPSLTDVHYNGTQEQWDKVKIDNTDDYNQPLHDAQKHFKVDYKFTVDANGVITSFEHTDKTVKDIVIPAEIGGIKVTGFDVNLFQYNTTITSVTIPEGVTSIGDYAFYKCSSLTSITLPSTLNEIGNNAFYDCTSLTNIDVNANNQNYLSDNGVLYNKDKTTIIFYPVGKTDTSFTIPSGVTSICDKAFYSCTGLQNITIPEGVKSIEKFAFSGCTSLTSVTIPEGVKSIGDMAFYDCTSLTSVTIPEGVTSIGESAFYGCTSLKSVTIPSSVESIGDSVFSHCTSLTSLTISKGVTSIGKSAFSYCTSLTSLTISEGVKSIGKSAFYECTSLTSVTIPEGVTSIGNYAFAFCTGLTSVTIPASVTSIGDSAFYNCTGLTSITIPEGVTSIGESAFGSCKSLTSITLPSTLTSTGNGVFSECTSLTSVTIPEGVTSIGDMAFSECSSLTSVTIPSTLTSTGNGVFVACTSLTSVTIPEGVTSIGVGAFGECTSLTSVTIPSTVTSIGAMAFYGCTSLTSVTIPSTVTSIDDRAFLFCSSLTSVTIPSSVTEINYGAFAFCENLADVHYNGTQEQWDKVKIDNKDEGNQPLLDATKHFKADKADYEFTVDENGVITEFIHSDTSVTDIVIPAEIGGVKVTGLGNNLFKDNKTITSVTIPEGVTSIGMSAFYGCPSLTSVTIPDGVTSIGVSAFYGCSSLISVTIPESVISIGGMAFYNCKGLTSVTIPEGVTSIGGSTFAYCSSLTSVTIPESVISIGGTAFYGCSSLSNVTIPSTLTKIDVGVFYDCPRLTDVYYNGTQAQWEQIEIDNAGDYNQLLHDVTKHYNKCAFAGASLTLQNNISVNYYVDKLAFDKFGYTELSATFTLNDRITVVDKYTTSADGKYYVFTFSGIAPQMMGDTITATLSATYNGEKVTSKVKEYSILQYCNNQLKESNIKAELKTLIVDLLNYGSMSQKGVNHNADNLVNAGLTADEQQAFVNWAKTNTYTNARNVTTNVANPVLTWTGASLNLNDSIDINVYFTMANTDVKSIVVKDKNNKIVDTITKFVDVGNNEKMVKFNKLIVSQLSDIYTFIAYDNNGEVVSNTLTYSVESYAYAKQNSTNKDLVNLVNAMMKYGESAKAYAETIKK